MPFRHLDIVVQRHGPKRPGGQRVPQGKALKRGPDGENPIRAARILRGLSGRQLAVQAGITPSMLSQIERSGKAAPAPEAQRFWRNASD
ncbi:MAG: helix-turn-helix transcriptional regulator [Mesorhizobium sp.]|nr:MAG: helix-turn-helix transcriptional regulator [Mesorhizobium sp.]